MEPAENWQASDSLRLMQSTGPRSAHSPIQPYARAIHPPDADRRGPAPELTPTSASSPYARAVALH